MSLNLSLTKGQRQIVAPGALAGAPAGRAIEVQLQEHSRITFVGTAPYILVSNSSESVPQGPTPAPSFPFSVHTDEPFIIYIRATSAVAATVNISWQPRRVARGA